jgi:lactoylglutathione lyase
MKICHVTIFVKSLEQSLAFYRDCLGLQVFRRFQSGEAEIVFLSGGETAIELICSPARREVSFGRDISIGFEVPSAEDMKAFLKQKGIATENIIQPNPNVQFFFATDPDGVRVQFVEYIKS